MIFIEVKVLNDHFRQQIVDFCLKSKPFSFCQLPSFRYRLKKINEYIDFLIKESRIFILHKEGKIEFLIAVSTKSSGAEVDFCFGSPFTIVKNFLDFRKDFFKKFPEIDFFWAKVTREFKLNKYVKAIQKRDKLAQIKIDNEEIIVYWFR